MVHLFYSPSKFISRLNPRLVNPYVLPVLYIRKPGDDEETRISFADDDPFLSEISAFIDNIENKEDSPKILSSYEGT